MEDFFIFFTVSRTSISRILNFAVLSLENVLIFQHALFVRLLDIPRIGPLLKRRNRSVIYQPIPTIDFVFDFSLNGFEPWITFAFTLVTRNIWVMLEYTFYALKKRRWWLIMAWTSCQSWKRATGCLWRIATRPNMVFCSWSSHSLPQRCAAATLYLMRYCRFFMKYIFCGSTIFGFCWSFPLWRF
jgi:hypothetical protein